MNTSELVSWMLCNETYSFLKRNCVLLESSEFAQPFLSLLFVRVFSSSVLRYSESCSFKHDALRKEKRDYFLLFHRNKTPVSVCVMLLPSQTITSISQIL